MSLLPGEESVLDISAILPEQDTSSVALPQNCELIRRAEE